MIENLVFSGGGLLGISYIGILKYLETKNFHIKTLVGTSIGSIFAFLLNIGYNYDEIYDEIIKLNLNDMKNISILYFIKYYGLDNGKKVTEWLKKLLNKKQINENITLKELYDYSCQKLIICVTDVINCKPYYISYENEPDLKVIKAIRMSISIPIIYSPIKYKNKYYIDGGMSDNFPLGIFNNQEDKTLGILLSGKPEDKYKHGLYDYIYKILKISVDCLENYQLKKYKETFKNIVIINCNIKYYMKFNMDDIDKKILIENAYNQIILKF